MGSAEKHLTSSLTALLVASVPMLAALMYRFAHVHERLGARRSTGLIVGMLGVVGLVGLSVGGSTWVGIAEMVPAVIGYTIGPLIIATKLAQMPGPGVVGASVGLVGLAYLPYGVTHLPSHISINVIGAIAVLAFVCTAIPRPLAGERAGHAEGPMRAAMTHDSPPPHVDAPTPPRSGCAVRS